ncbi:hypothetical protein BJX64DRAFT_247882 [Aspergillus heterothallicus]
MISNPPLTLRQLDLSIQSSLASLWSWINPSSTLHDPSTFQGLSQTGLAPSRTPFASAPQTSFFERISKLELLGRDLFCQEFLTSKQSPNLLFANWPFSSSLFLHDSAVIRCCGLCFENFFLGASGPVPRYQFRAHATRPQPIYYEYLPLPATNTSSEYSSVFSPAPSFIQYINLDSLVVNL